MSRLNSATAFAPATVANVAVGFDLLGFSVDFAGDQVTVERIPEPRTELGRVSGLESNLPRDPLTNCATAGLERLRQDLELDHGFRVSIRKGIALGSGIGGSAASAVASVVAANALLESPLPRERLMTYALIGESVASGGFHADNVAPCLYGGLTLATLFNEKWATKNPPSVQVTRIPVPPGIHCVLVHPRLRIDTRTARHILHDEVPLKDFVTQSANLAGFISGCFLSDLSLIRHSLKDRVIEPQRAALIPGFYSAQEAALHAGALGCSISGSGPSVFAWARDAEEANGIREAMTTAFARVDVPADSWVQALPGKGARLLP